MTSNLSGGNANEKDTFYLPVAVACGVLAYLVYLMEGIYLNVPFLCIQLGVILVFLASAILLDKGLWYGCIPEVALGLWFLYCGVTNTTPPLIDELSIGIGLTAYYLVCGFVAYRSLRKA